MTINKFTKLTPKYQTIKKMQIWQKPEIIADIPNVKVKIIRRIVISNNAYLLIIPPN